MKRVTLSDLPDMSALSQVLDQALYLLANSPVQFRASDLSRATGIHSSVLTRMKLLHSNPQYESLVSQYLLMNVLKFLFQCFPTLALGQTRDGRVVVQLFKKYNGYRLEPLPEQTALPELFKPKAPKPGSTRWFLEQNAPVRPPARP